VCYFFPSEQLQNLEKITKNTTPSEQLQNLEKAKNYHTLRTITKSRKTKNTTPSKQLQNLEKQKIPHHRNNHKI
jgi:hypothetical protein